jgi:hypothetical protein
MTSEILSAISCRRSSVSATRRFSSSVVLCRPLSCRACSSAIAAWFVATWRTRYSVSLGKSGRRDPATNTAVLSDGPIWKTAIETVPSANGWAILEPRQETPPLRYVSSACPTAAGSGEAPASARSHWETGPRMGSPTRR